jgi:hypothetical protein
MGGSMMCIQQVCINTAHVNLIKEITMNEITMTPISILVKGAKKSERQISALRQSSGSAITACLDVSGAVGKEIRGSAVRAGLVDVAKHAASGNYRPMAEMLAIRTGEPVLISSRATFEAMPDIFKARVEQAKLGKDGGYRLDKKTGAMVPGAKLKSALEMLALVEGIAGAVAEYHAQRTANTESPTLRRAA